MCKRQKILSEMHKKTIVVSALRISVPTKKTDGKNAEFLHLITVFICDKIYTIQLKTPMKVLSCAGLNNGRRTAGREAAQHGITACRFAAAVKLPGCVFCAEA